MVPEFSKAAFSTKPGDISNLIKTEFGYHIIKIVDRKKAGLTPFDEVRPQIEKYLEQQNKMISIQKLIESSRNNAKIVYLDKEYDPKKIEIEIREIAKKQKNIQSKPKKDVKN
jgi:parvulin-like peptidyl-prolyl isomerase